MCLAMQAAAHGMHLVVLTCFDANVAARQFYARRGYAMDSTSPALWRGEGEPSAG